MEQKTRKAFRAPCQVLMGHLLEALPGEDEEARRDYAFTLLTRLVFAFFLQRKGLLDGNPRYLQHHLELCRNEDTPFATFLATLYYGGLGTPHDELPHALERLLGEVPYLSGSLFQPHTMEEHSMQQIGKVAPPMPNQIFEEFFSACEGFTWTLEECKDIGGPEGVVTPAILGHLVEHHVPHRKETGSYYTSVDICTYIVKETCEPIILRQFAEFTGQHYDTIDQLLSALSARDCGFLLFVVLPTVSVLDPACGAADFLIVAQRKLYDIYQYVIQRAISHHHPVLDQWLMDFDEAHSCRAYALKKRVATRNLFGVDIQKAPLEMAKMRLALNLLSGLGDPYHVEPLPNLDYKLPRGNSLIGLDRLTEAELSRLKSLYPQYEELVKVKNTLVHRYQETCGNPLMLGELQEEIEACRRTAYVHLDRVLWEKVMKKGAVMEEKVRDSETGRNGTRKRPFTLEDLISLDTFHWAFDMNNVMCKPWWKRLDGDEATVVQIDGKFHVRFGPEHRRDVA